MTDRYLNLKIGIIGMMILFCVHGCVNAIMSRTKLEHVCQAKCHKLEMGMLYANKRDGCVCDVRTKRVE